jgi:uncharacterized protein YjbI with pentapeptide repeats
MTYIRSYSNSATRYSSQAVSTDEAQVAFDNLTSEDKEERLNALCTMASISDKVLKNIYLDKMGEDLDDLAWEQLPVSDFMRKMIKDGKMEEMVNFVNRLNLSNLSLENADFSDMRICGLHLTGTAEDGAIKMGRANFNGATLENCYFERVEMNNTDLSFCFIENTTFQSCKLIDADMVFSQQSNVEYKSCDVSGADLRMARLVEVNFNSSNLIGANCVGANFCEVIIPDYSHYGREVMKFEADNPPKTNPISSKSEHLRSRREFEKSLISSSSANSILVDREKRRLAKNEQVPKSVSICDISSEVKYTQLDSKTSLPPGEAVTTHQRSKGEYVGVFDKYKNFNDN